MSVLVPELKVFEQILRKVDSFKFKKVCDIDYCNALSLEEKGARDFVQNILHLNELTYNRTYEEQEQEIMLFEMLNLSGNADKVDTLQLLKFLQCVSYNIDLLTVRTGRRGQDSHEISQNLLSSHELLLKAIDELKDTVIKELTDYNAKSYANAI